MNSELVEPAETTVPLSQEEREAELRRIEKCISGAAAVCMANPLSRRRRPPVLVTVEYKSWSPEGREALLRGFKERGLFTSVLEDSGRLRVFRPEKGLANRPRAKSKIMPKSAPARTRLSRR